MTTDNDVIDLIKNEKNEKKEKKEKNPNRVAGGKKSVEARKKKLELAELAEIKIKEAEVLKKENLELKQITRVTFDTPTKENTASLKENTASLKESSFLLGKDYKLLLYFSIGIGVLGLFIKGTGIHLKQGEHTCPKRVVTTPIEYTNHIEKKEKKEIDPFDF